MFFFKTVFLNKGATKMPCMNALPIPKAIEDVLDFMMIGDDEDWAHEILRRVYHGAYENPVPDILRQPQPYWYVDHYNLLVPPRFWPPRRNYEDILIQWVEIRLHHPAHHALYTDFTALRLERARILAQRFENFSKGYIKKWA
jgi:hypothetical protein